jgi:3-hydroxyacyl-CoA dehydrogenase, NAD binding domain
LRSIFLLLAAVDRNEKWPPRCIAKQEIVGGAKTSEQTIQRVAEFYTGLGKQAVRLRKEVPGHVVFAQAKPTHSIQ